MNQNKELEELKESGDNVKFILTDESTLQGTVNWFDNFNINITTEIAGEDRQVTIMKHGIICYYRF